MATGVNLDRALSEVMQAVQALKEVTARLGGGTSGAGGQPIGGAAFAAAAGASAGAGASAAMAVTPLQKRIIERVINTFETGRPDGRYGAVVVMADGPGGRRQITYGRSQTTEAYHLRELIDNYANANGTLSAALRPYVAQIGQTPLADNEAFKQLLRDAGNDPVMQRTQDAFFDRRYYQPALRWAQQHGFSRALSMLVIYDSFIHSGGILDTIRSRFPERPPALGGSEQVWIGQYVAARDAWLRSRSNPLIQASAYRTRDLLREVNRGNWDLALLPISANGTPVDAGAGAAAAAGAAPGNGAAFAVPPVDETLYAVAYDAEGEGEDSAGVADTGASLGPDARQEPAAAGGNGAEWSEHEPPAGDVHAFFAAAALAGPAAGATTAALAAQILRSPNIDLATSHISGVADQATARQNIIDTAAGRPARRSSYGTAPGGTVALDARMLTGMLALAAQYSFTVTEICGGSHSANSRHYAGIGFDVGTINGQNISMGHPAQAAFRARCRQLGANEVLGPGDANHSTHIHAAWPRP